ncbi:hypothetical protein C7N43_07105 [Sphingobacteriales bacterium UPWRP_1]|nr:hypothetical protein C7N43_07105 [Sphingobacteriales bacterium UPWRP_1]
MVQPLRSHLQKMVKCCVAAFNSYTNTTTNKRGFANFAVCKTVHTKNVVNLTFCYLFKTL